MAIFGMELRQARQARQAVTVPCFSDHKLVLDCHILSCFIQFYPILSSSVQFCPILSGFVQKCPFLSYQYSSSRKSAKAFWLPWVYASVGHLRTFRLFGTPKIASVGWILRPTNQTETNGAVIFRFIHPVPQLWLSTACLVAVIPSPWLHNVRNDGYSSPHPPVPR